MGGRVTRLLDTVAWSAGMQMIVAKERAHAGAQLRFTDIYEYRFTRFASHAKQRRRGPRTTPAPASTARGPDLQMPRSARPVANLDGSRSHGARWDVLAGAKLRMTRPASPRSTDCCCTRHVPKASGPDACRSF